jgi:hypothetical protein
MQTITNRNPHRTCAFFAALAALSGGAHTALAGGTILSCNEGALTVETDAERGGFQAIVWDAGVVSYFKRLEGTSVKTVQHG